MTDALDELVDLLDLEPVETDYFRGRTPLERRQRAFGGQVAGQALIAAGRTVEPDRTVHSMHAYFLRPGLPGVPILYQVDRIRDGRSFTTRRVVAVQQGKAIFNLAASFHRSEPGIDHQSAMPAAPEPESLPTWHERMAPLAGVLGDWYTRPRPIDVRYEREPWPSPQGPRDPSQRVWIRADGKLPDDPLLHACVVAYASDMTLVDSILLPHRSTGEIPDSFQGLMLASLDHAMWFHRPFRADEWLLYDQESPSAAGARGLARGEIFRRDGGLVVSVVQEGLVRVIDAPGPT